MTLKTEIASLSRSQLLRLNQSLKEACTNLMGTSNPLIRTFKNSNSNGVLAFYDFGDNCILIYRGMIKTVEQYVKVFIHEWIHSRQEKIFTHYLAADLKYGYRKNPFEVEARQGETLYKSDVWKQVKKLMK